MLKVQVDRFRSTFNGSVFAQPLLKVINSARPQHLSLILHLVMGFMVNFRLRRALWKPRTQNCTQEFISKSIYR